MVHQLAGLGDTAESPLGLEYWERDGELGPEYDEVIEQSCFDCQANVTFYHIDTKLQVGTTTKGN